LEENMYGALVYQWARKKESWAQYIHLIVLTMLFFLSIYIQVVFAWYMIPHISKNENAEKITPTENQFATWRSTVGTEHASLACKESEWSWAESVVDEMGKYLAPAKLFLVIPMTRGQMFGVLSMGLWVCLWVIQLRACISSALIICLDDKVLQEVGANAEDKKQKAIISKMEWNLTTNPWAKIVIITTFLIRVSLTMCFGYFGMEFLANTQTLRDFILNCVALAFVFEVPDTIYSAFGFIDTQQSIRHLNQAWQDTHAKVLLKSKLGGFISLASTLLFFATALGAFVMGMKGLNKYSDMMRDSVYGQICAKTPGNNTVLF
jgi:ABC-type multidrug transport system fused ATPase/permease subunit